jgi:hypothetical protein
MMSNLLALMGGGIVFLALAMVAVPGGLGFWGLPNPIEAYQNSLHLLSAGTGLCRGYHIAQFGLLGLLA